MATSEPKKPVSTGQSHKFKLIAPRWVGHQRYLYDDKTVEFIEFLPFRPRGAQVVLDPLEPVAPKVSVTGRVLSPARILEPGSAVKAWVEGGEVSVKGNGSFQATVMLHVGTDQIHVRAQDKTKLQGRGYVSTWTPKRVQPRGEDDPPWLDRNEGAPQEEDGIATATSKPIRYGRTRAEVQRFAIHPALVDKKTIDLVLKDEKEKELGRVTVKLKHEGETRSWTEWVCITATDPLVKPALPAIEGRIFRVPDLKCTLELQLSGGKLIGDPLRMSGLDPLRKPAVIQQLANPETPVDLDVVLGGRYEADALNLTWMTDADEDAVLLPGEGVPEGSQDLKGALQAKSAQLGELEPVDLSQEKVRFPTGWGSLVLEGNESKDPWRHDELDGIVDVVTYQEAPELDSPEANDFVHSARPPRVAWHPTDEWAVNPDQVYVQLKKGTADEALTDLCRKKGLNVAGTVRRDAHILLESPEPLDFVELQKLVDELGGESIFELVTFNLTAFRAEENVASIRAPDVLRSAALMAPQPGCYRPYDILTLRHHLQTRALPAQQILEHLRFQQGAVQSQISLAVVDDGFGNTSLPNISPDFALPRLPWRGRSPGGGAGAWGSFPANIGATLSFTAWAMVDTGAGNQHIKGHGTRVLHVAAGHGTAFSGLQATIPPLVAAAAIANYRTSPWCVGVAPMAQAFPLRWTNGAGVTANFRILSAARFAFLQRIEVVNASVQAQGAPPSPPIPAAQVAAQNALIAPMFAQARAIGGIWVMAGGNQPQSFNLNLFTRSGVTGARAAASRPEVIITATNVRLIPPPFGANWPLTFTNPWSSVERQVNWANFGPQATVGAPGEDLNLRAFSLTAASTTAHLGAGTGTSFSAPQVAGLLALMKLADRIMGRVTPRPGVPTPADGANRLIDLMCFTAHRAQPLFTAAQAAAQFAPRVGHGRIDCWAAVLSVLNDGPMFAGTAPHANLRNTGTYIQPAAAEIFYGFELDTPAYHAKPWLVNVDTGASEEIVDALALDPVIDPSNPARPVWTYQARAGGAGDRILPPSRHAGLAPSYMLQFTIRKTRLRAYTHLCFQRGPNEPPIVSTPGNADLTPGNPNLFYYGLPLAPLLSHNVTGPALTPFRVDMRHFIFKAHTNQHDRRLRVTFDRVEISGAVVADTVEVQWTVGGQASGYTTYPAKQNAVVFLSDASRAFYQPANAPLPISFEVKPFGVAAVSYQPPATPTARTFTPWGLGHRFLEVGGGFKVYFRVEQEANLPRVWKAELEKVKLTSAAPGRYVFAVESGGMRSAWSAATTIQSKLRVTYERLRIIDDQDWGAGEWRLKAFVNDTMVGELNRDVNTGDVIALGWSKELLPQSGGTLRLKVTGKEIDTVSDDALGDVSLQFDAGSNWGIGTRTLRASGNASYEVTIKIEPFTGVVEVPIAAGSVVARSPFVPSQSYDVAFRIENLGTMTSSVGTQRPASLASNAVESLTIAIQPGIEAHVKVSSDVVLQLFA